MMAFRFLAALPAAGIGLGILVAGCHGSASCGDACTHYLTCAGASGAYESDCVSSCESWPVATPDWLDSYVGTDCTTAVAIVDDSGGTSGWGPANNSSSGGSNTSSSGNTSSGGGGCYPDGHKCSAGGDCCNGNCIDQSVGDWICY